MSDVWLRIFIAALFSVLGMIMTYGISHRYHSHFVEVDKPSPVARIVSSQNEILRRPAQRLIWQRALSQQELYPGEALRTASDAEAEIEFLGRDATVQLDPDTVIEIDENDGEMNLDFLKGNLLIRSNDAKKKITLKSGDQKIALGKSIVSVSKSKTKNSLDLDVLKGQIQILNKGTKTQPIFQPKLKMISPTANGVVFLSGKKGEIVAFRCEGVGTDYQIKLLQGPARNRLQENMNITPVKNSCGVVVRDLSVGRQYFQLQAESKNKKNVKLLSSVFRVDFRSKQPPVPVEPVQNSMVSLQRLANGIDFRWANPGELSELIFEVASDKNLKHSMKKERFYGKKLSHSIILKDLTGAVYWRVSGKLPSGEFISSPVQKLNISNQVAQILNSPLLKAPLHLTNVDFDQQKEKPLTLVWTPVKGAAIYEVTISEDLEDSSQERDPWVWTQDVEMTKLILRPLAMGTYSWSVVAKKSDGARSRTSATWKFKVAPQPRIPAAIQPPPLLPAPEFHPSTGPQIVASDEGTVEVRWLPVLKAQQYVLSIKSDSMGNGVGGDSDANASQSMRFSSTSARLTGLKTGNYLVIMQSVDAGGRVGPEGMPRRLSVPEYSKVPAPVLKSIDIN